LSDRIKISIALNIYKTILPSLQNSASKEGRFLVFS